MINLKKILLLTTGGTIASTGRKEGLIPTYSAYDLLECVPELLFMASIHGIDIMKVDSSNMQPEYWRDIAIAVHRHYDAYDGFVITHGTDTIGYTSAALSYMLQGLSKPIVVTGAQKPISYFDTDAKKNLRLAVQFALKGLSGVFVAFGGKIILGTRAMKLRTRSYDAFVSVNYPYIAYLERDFLRVFTEHVPNNTGQFKLDISLNTNVLLVKLFPGFQPEIFDYAALNCQGVIVESFGVGGIPFEKRDVAAKIMDLALSGVSVVITTQCLEDGVNLDIYHVGKRLAGHPIISARDMNTEAILAKLMWALGKTSNQRKIKSIMEQPIAGDQNRQAELSFKN